MQAEQKLLQKIVLDYREREPGCWPSVNSALNELLNRRYRLGLLLRRGEAVGSIARARIGVGFGIDFAKEMHRVEFGLALIKQVQFERASGNRFLGFYTSGNGLTEASKSA